MVAVTAEWCPYCTRFMPILTKVANELGLPVEQVDIERNPKRAEEFKVTAYPTWFLFCGPHESVKIEGARTEEQVRVVLQRCHVV